MIRTIILSVKGEEEKWHPSITSHLQQIKRQINYTTIATRLVPGGKDRLQQIKLQKAHYVISKLRSIRTGGTAPHLNLFKKRLSFMHACHPTTVYSLQFIGVFVSWRPQWFCFFFWFHFLPINLLLHFPLTGRKKKKSLTFWKFVQSTDQYR